MFPLRDENPTSRPPVVTLLLIVACVAVYLFWQQEPQRSLQEDFAFNVENTAIPCEVISGEPLSTEELEALAAGNTEACGVGSDGSEPFPDKDVFLALFTSMFLHGGWLHIGGNMLYLWIFGNNIEDHLGIVRYVLFYVAGGLAAAATHIALNPDSLVPVVGASGAIAAVMGAYLVWFPEAPVRTVIFFFLIALTDIRAKWLLGFWFVSQFFTSPNSGVAWAAHVGGFVFGVIVGLIVRRSRRAQRAAWRRRYADQMSPAHWDPTGGVGRNPYPTRRYR